MQRKNNSYCSVPQCKQYAEPGISFHRFPNNMLVKKKWVHALKIGKPISKGMKVCSRHFSKDDYLLPEIPTKQPRLKKCAIPTKNIPVGSVQLKKFNSPQKRERDKRALKRNSVEGGDYKDQSRKNDDAVERYDDFEGAAMEHSEIREEEHEKAHPLPKIIAANSSQVSDSSRYGYWPDSEVLNFLNTYIKHVQEQPLLNGKADNAMWQKISAEFDHRQFFTVLQMQTKLTRLKYAVKGIIKNGSPIDMNAQIFKLVKFILDMDEGGLKFNASKSIFSEEDLLNLVEAYGNISVMFHPNKGPKHQMWAMIAKEVAKPETHVKRRFQLLKRHWQRWASMGKATNVNMYNVLKAFDNMQKQEAKFTNKRKTDVSKSSDVAGSDKIDGRWKWSPEGVTILLDNYKAKLEELLESDKVITKKDVCLEVANVINVPVEVVATKVLRLKTFYEKRSTHKWVHKSVLDSICKLEKSIWGLTENGTTADTDQSDVEDNIIIDDPNEPEWFKKYRTEVEERHNDRIHILNRLVQVMQSLVNRS